MLHYRGGWFVVFAVIAVALASCGASETKKAASEAGHYRSADVRTDNSMKQLALAVKTDTSKSMEVAETTKSTEPLPERKIIFTGQISLVVEDLSEFEKGLKAEVAKSGGYVSQIREDRTFGDQRTGHWVLRVPGSHFQTVLDALAELGVSQVRHVNSQDVTEEFFDLDARIATKKKLIERLDKILADKTGDVKVVLAVQNELFRVQEELERMQGRLKYLSDQTTLTTITVDAREDRDYEPPAAPTFPDKIAQSWTHSFTSLAQFGENIVLAVVVATPWLLSGIIVIGLPLLLFRVRRRMRRTDTITARPA